MITIAERFVWALSLLMIAACAVTYFVYGPESITPEIAVTGRETNEQGFLDQLQTKEAKAAVKSAKPLAPPTKEGEEKSKRRRGSKPTVRHRIVSRAMVDRVDNYNRARHAVSDVTARVKETKSGFRGLEITGFDEKSLLGKVGLEDGDTILGIGGEALDFDDLTKARSILPGGRTHDVYQDFKERLDGGEPIRVDLERNGKPVQIWFTLEDY